jgi:hypothetical protein
MGWNAKLQIERKRGRGNSGREGERRSRCYAFGLSYCVWVTSSAPDRGSGLWCNASARRVPETQRTSPYDQNASLPGCLPSTHRPRATRRRKQRKRAVRALPGASQPANTAFPLPLRGVVRSTLPPAVKYGRGKRADAEHVGASEPTAPGRRGGGRSPPTLRRRTKRPPPPFLTAHAFVPLCASPACHGNGGAPPARLPRTVQEAAAPRRDDHRGGGRSAQGPRLAQRLSGFRGGGAEAGTDQGGGGSVRGAGVRLHVAVAAGAASAAVLVKGCRRRLCCRRR